MLFVTLKDVKEKVVPMHVKNEWSLPPVIINLGLDKGAW